MPGSDSTSHGTPDSFPAPRGIKLLPGTPGPVGLALLALLILGKPTHCLTATSTARRTVLDPYKLNAGTRDALEANKRKQVDAVRGLESFHDFRFSDRIDESRITFESRPVDDAAKNWKPAHYDHGTGVAATDVDGDGLTDIFFAGQLRGNQLWRNLGKGRFEDITARAGVALEDRVCVAAAFADIDNDSKPDLFVTSVKKGNALFRNLGGGRFENISAKSGLDYKGHSSGVCFFDFDNDGLLDLFVANVGVYTSGQTGSGGFFLAYQDAFARHLRPEFYEQSILYRNLGGGRFQDVSKVMNLEHKAWSGDASVCDVNEDGRPDLYVLSMQGDDLYYENQGGKRFAEKTSVHFPKTPWGAMGIKFFDFDLDGRMDLFITDMHSDMTDAQTKDGKTRYAPDFEKKKSEPWCSLEWSDSFLQGASNNVFGNAFYRNLGNGRFREVSEEIGAETYWPWGVSVGDLNADGYEDVFVTAGMGYPFRYGINSVLLNNLGRRFFDSEFVLGVEPRKDGKIEAEYFTLDGTTKDKDHPLAYKRGIISVLGSLSTRSSVLLDLDDDGDLDIVTNEMIGRPQVLVSNLSEKRRVHFLKVRLVGTTSNRDGLGATVKVRVGSRNLVRYHDGKSGYLAQSSSLPLYFGLGDTTRADSVEVLWPSGRRQLLTDDIPANALMEIVEPRQ